MPDVINLADYKRRRRWLRGHAKGGQVRITTTERPPEPPKAA